MRRDEVERITLAKPFQPFEVKLVDGERWTFSSPESFVLMKGVIRAQDKEGRTVFLDTGLVLTITLLEVR